MTTEQLVNYLRSVVNIQNEDVQDSVYLSMSDEDILLYLNIALTNYPDIPSLQNLPNEYVYPIILLAKKELYYALAVKDAPLYDLGADNNNYLKRSQRFDHYMKLVQQTDSEYNDYLDNGGAGGNTLASYNVLLSNRYATKFNYENGVIPALTLYTDEVTKDSISISWRAKMLGNFYRYRVFISKEPVLDIYKSARDKIDYSKVLDSIEIKDVHQCKARFSGLEAGTYYITLSCSLLSNLTGYAEMQTTILAEDEGGE